MDQSARGDREVLITRMRVRRDLVFRFSVFSINLFAGAWRAGKGELRVMPRMGLISGRIQLSCSRRPVIRSLALLNVNIRRRPR